MNKSTKTEENKEKAQTKTPNENAGVLVQSKIKIFDPESGKVFVNQRA